MARGSASWSYASWPYLPRSASPIARTARTASVSVGRAAHAPRQPSEDDRVAHVLAVRGLHQMPRPDAHAPRLVALVLTHHVRREGSVHQLHREAMRQQRSLPIHALEVEKPDSSGTLIAPTQYQHVGDLTTFAQNAATFAFDGCNELSTTRSRGRSDGSGARYSINIGKSKSRDGSLSVLMSGAASRRCGHRPRVVGSRRRGQGGDAGRVQAVLRLLDDLLRLPGVHAQQWRKFSG